MFSVLLISLDLKFFAGASAGMMVQFLSVLASALLAIVGAMAFMLLIDNKNHTNRNCMFLGFSTITSTFLLAFGVSTGAFFSSVVGNLILLILGVSTADPSCTALEKDWY